MYLKMKTTQKVTGIAVITLFLFSLMFFSSCKKKTAVSNASLPVNKNELRFDSLMLNESISLFADSQEPHNKLNIHFAYPVQVEGDTALLTQIQHQFTRALFGDKFAQMTPQKALDAYYQKYKSDFISTRADYQEARKDGMSMASWGNTYQIMRSDSVSSINGILSFTTYIENYMGGAHGSHQTGYYNIDLKTGKLITESEFFKAGYAPLLKKIIIDQLVADNKLRHSEELIDKGFFDLDEMKPNGNFLIQKEGVQYAFNEYEIAPYYMGVIKVFIPYAKISDLIQKR